VACREVFSLPTGYPLGASDTTMTVVNQFDCTHIGHCGEQHRERRLDYFSTTPAGETASTISHGGTSWHPPARAVIVGQGNMAGIVSEFLRVQRAECNQQWGGNGSSIGVYNPWSDCVFLCLVSFKSMQVPRLPAAGQACMGHGYKSCGHRL